MISRCFFILFSLFCAYPTYAAPQPTPPSVFKSNGNNGLYLLDKSQKRLFATFSEMDAYYNKLLTILKANPPASTATAYLNAGNHFFISPDNLGQPPVLPNKNVSDDYMLLKYCPIKLMEGGTPNELLNGMAITLLQKKNKPLPAGDKLLGLDKAPASANQYIQALRVYAQAWNKQVMPYCMKKAGILDMTIAKPVVVTHKVIGDDVFILDEPPFKNPRKEVMSKEEEQVYHNRLREAIAKKDPEKDVGQAIKNNNLYFLGYRNNVWIDIRGGLRNHYSISASAFIGAYNDPGRAYDGQEYLRKLCRSRFIEGTTERGSAAIAIYKDYATVWNARMFQVCQAKVEKLFASQLALQRASRKFRATVGNYVFTLQSDALMKGEALQVKSNQSGTQVIRLRDGSLVDVKQIPNMDGLFALVNQAFTKKNSSVHAEYDKKYGYLTYLRIQPSGGKAIQYAVSDFQSLR